MREPKWHQRRVCVPSPPVSRCSSSKTTPDPYFHSLDVSLSHSLSIALHLPFLLNNAPSASHSHRARWGSCRRFRSSYDQCRTLTGSPNNQDCRRANLLLRLSFPHCLALCLSCLLGDTPPRRPGSTAGDRLRHCRPNLCRREGHKDRHHGAWTPCNLVLASNSPKTRIRTLIF